MAKVVRVPKGVKSLSRNQRKSAKKTKPVKIEFIDSSSKKVVKKPSKNKLYLVSVSQGKKRNYFKYQQKYSPQLKKLLEDKVKSKNFYTLHEDNTTHQFLLRASKKSTVSKFFLNKFYSHVDTYSDYEHTFKMQGTKSGYYTIPLNKPTLIRSLQSVALKLSRSVHKAMKKPNPGILFYNFFFTLEIDGKKYQLPGPSRQIDLAYDPNWETKDNDDINISGYKNPALRRITHDTKLSYYNFSDAVARLGWIKNEIAYSMRVALKSLGYRFTSLATLDKIEESMELTHPGRHALRHIGVSKTPVESLKQIKKNSLSVTLWFDFFD